MRRTLIILAALALALTACSGGDDADAATTPASDAATGTTADEPAPSTTAGDPDDQPARPGGPAAPGDTVAVHYRGTLDDGTEFDNSAGRDPLEFVVGAGHVIPGFNAAVEGLSEGDSVTVRIPVEDAYGERDDALIQDVPLSQLPEGVAEGDELVSGAGQVVTVVGVGEESAAIDFNHRLAGQALTFEITVISITAP